MPSELEKRNKLLDESMQRAMTKVMAQYPGTKPVTVSPSSSSLITSLMMPRGAMAVTNPFTGNITYNRDAMEGQSDTDMEQTLAHELTHVRQTQNQPWWKTAASLFAPDEKVPAGYTGTMNSPYYWRPREMEAFQTERDRAQQMNIPNYADPVTGSTDIRLPSMKRKQSGPINTGPSNKVTAPLFKDPLADALAKSKAGMSLSPEEQNALNRDMAEYHQSAYYKSLNKGR
jgi:hypothetical protein